MPLRNVAKNKRKTVLPFRDVANLKEMKKKGKKIREKLEKSRALRTLGFSPFFLIFSNTFFKGMNREKYHFYAYVSTRSKLYGQN